MIYVGYPCIGKTSISNKDTGYIDLESSNFEKTDNWAETYTKIAIDLSDQGYNVFVSSHKEVRLALIKQKATFICIFPALELKNIWIDRIYNRSIKGMSEKDNKALVHVFQHYEEDIKDLMKEDHPVIITEEQFKNKEITEYETEYELYNAPNWKTVCKKLVTDENGRPIVRGVHYEFDLMRFMDSIVKSEEMFISE